MFLNLSWEGWFCFLGPLTFGALVQLTIWWFSRDTKRNT